MLSATQTPLSPAAKDPAALGFRLRRKGSCFQLGAIAPNNAPPALPPLAHYQANPPPVVTFRL